MAPRKGAKYKKMEGVLSFPDGKVMPRMSDKHRRIAELEVTGKFTREQIGKEVGLSTFHVNRLLREDMETLQYLGKLRDECAEEARAVRLAAENELMKATVDFVKVLTGIANNPEAQDNARVSAARFGLQFAGMRLENRDDTAVKTPHLAIRDGKEKFGEEKKEVSKTG